MFSENLKTARTQKGMSQEILAQRLNVVRQTVSKWEQGLSVPDAEMLTKISEILEVPVADLLGAKINQADQVNEVAAQLALLNEYLTKKSRTRKKVWQWIGIVVLAVIIVSIIIVLSLTKM